MRQPPGGRLLLMLLAAWAAGAQTGLGALEVTVHDRNGSPWKQGVVRIANENGATIDLRVADGVSKASLTPGSYCASVRGREEQFNGCVCFEVQETPVSTVRLVADGESARDKSEACPVVRPAPYSTAERALSFDALILTYPLGWGGLSQPRLWSLAGLSWLATEFEVDRVPTTDPYSRGTGMAEVPPEFVEAVHVHPPGQPAAANSYGPVVDLELRRPQAQWHARAAAIHSGLGMTWNNVPRASGSVFASDRFFRLDRDSVEVTAPVSRRVHLLLAANAQSGSQAVPSSDSGGSLRRQMRSLLLRSSIALRRGELNVTIFDSGTSQANWSLPPAFALFSEYGIASPLQPVADQSGHTRSGRMQISYRAPLRTDGMSGGLDFGVASTRNSGESTSSRSVPGRVLLETGDVVGSSPFDGSTARQATEMHASLTLFAGSTERITNKVDAAGALEFTGWTNRIATLAAPLLIEAGGAPAFLVQFDKPAFAAAGAGMRSTVSLYDRVGFGKSVRIEGSVAFSADHVAGRNGAAAPQLAWRAASPRLGITFTPPLLRRLVLHASVARTSEPLSGRLLDFLNPSSISGRVYSTEDCYDGAAVGAPESCHLLRRFGGAYAAPQGRIGAPYATHLRSGATLPLSARVTASVTAFRTDEKRRLALENVGAPLTAYDPVWIRDPGADFTPFTWDDQQFLVFAQSRESLGQDRYILDNPPGLRTATMGLSFELALSARRFQTRLSYNKMKSIGPSNPGNTPWANDPEAVGSLYLSPNYLFHSDGHSYFDRANSGGIWTQYSPFGKGPSVGVIAAYLDGSPFARELLVTGLPQGPFLVAATPRGSPEGGHRTEYLVNLDARIAQTVRVPAGRAQVFADILNVLNGGRKVAERDLSGPDFNLRLPLAIQPSRSVRVGLIYWF